MTYRLETRREVACLTLATLALGGCGGSDRIVSPQAVAVASASAAASTTAVRVQPGMSIQAAIDAAGAGGQVLIEPGTYLESITVTAPNVRLLGLGASGSVVIANPGGADNGIRVASTAPGFELDNVTVRGFVENGVQLVGVDGFRLTRVRAEDDGEYGLFPVFSSHGVIDGCSATGAADTGIYVGQSSDIEIRNSVAQGNVAGFELENTTRVSLSASVAFDNTVGVLVSLVPGVPVMTASDNVVAHNRIYDNNRANFGDPEDLAGHLPAGSGIIVIGPDRTTISHNTVTGNVSTGIAIVSAQLIPLLAGLPPDAYGSVDTSPDETRVEFNLVTGNGAEPQPPVDQLFPGVDLLWDGTGVGNCWYRNRFDTSAPSPLPACR
jgi:parallel beta-helix repeat protein